MATVRGSITVKPHVQRCADAVVAEFGPGLSPGTYNGHSPPEGPTQALDLFNPQTSAGWDLQRRIADWLITNQTRFGVRYVIKWNPNGQDWIWNVERASEGWRAMATRDHRDHVHVTFYAVVAGGEPTPVPTPPSQEDDMQSNWFRYVHGGQDWIVDRLAKKVTATTDLDQLKVLDKLGCIAIGSVSRAVHDYMKGTYNG